MNFKRYYYKGVSNLFENFFKKLDKSVMVREFYK